MDLGLLVARLIVGSAIAAHGSQKLFGWFAGPGLANTGAFMESLGFRPGREFAIAAGCCEFLGGTLLTLGWFGAVGPVLVIVSMTVAALTVHAHHGFFETHQGLELPLIYATAVFTLATTGFGFYSMDAMLGTGVLSTPAAVCAASVAAIVVGVLTATLRHPLSHHAPLAH